MNINDLNTGSGGREETEGLAERLITILTHFLFVHNIPNKMASRFNYCFYIRS